MFSKPWPICDRVLVNLTAGDAISGLLVDQRGPLLVLAHASLIAPGNAEPTPMDGQVFIERSAVAFLQALPPKG